ncbi:MAG: ABC transporter permease subunit [Bacteroidales bacterium]|nr:MAG: ABC transporter permease subunit [Bacteroidales bacterium]
MKLLEEKIFKALMLISAFVIIAVIGYILFTIVSKGIGSLTWDMISKGPGGGFYLGKEGGVLNAIVGSFYLVIGAVVIALFLSIPVTMYINFYLTKTSFFAKTVRFSFDILFGIPSIVYGAFGFAVMIYFGLKASLFGGIVVVGMLITPIIMRSLDEVARFIPRDLIEAPLSLGATKYEMIKILLRQLMPGITTAVLLAIGRGIGDAATVLFTAGYTDNIPTSLSHPTATLPLAIFFQLGSPIEEVQNRAYASALILTIIILILSLSARYFSRKLSKNKV